MDNPTIQDRRTAVTTATALLSGLSQVAHQVDNADLGPFFRDLDDLSKQVDAARVALLGEALS